MAYKIDQPVQLMRVLGERCDTAKTCHTHCSYNIQQTLAPMPRNKLLNMFHVGAAVVCLIFTAESYCNIISLHKTPTIYGHRDQT